MTLGWYELFPYHEPVEYPQGSGEFSLRISHGTHGVLSCHNLTDPVNEGVSPLERRVLSYRINGSDNALLTVRDFVERPHLFEKESLRRVESSIGEDIARRVMKYWLHHLRDRGRVAGLYKEATEQAPSRDGLIVAHNAEHILKITTGQNMVILRRSESERAKFGLEVQAELDGLMGYQKDGHHLLVTEVKTGNTSIQAEDATRVLEPMRGLFPDRSLTYIIFGLQDEIFVPRWFATKRQVQPELIRLYQTLRQKGIATLFFTFAENKGQLETAARHVSETYNWFTRKESIMKGTLVKTATGIRFIPQGTEHALLNLAIKEHGLYEDQHQGKPI